MGRIGILNETCNSQEREKVRNKKEQENNDNDNEVVEWIIKELIDEDEDKEENINLNNNQNLMLGNRYKLGRLQYSKMWQIENEERKRITKGTKRSRWTT